MIARDGARTSLWQDTTAARQETTDTITGKYDVAIVGGGITGITLALQLQEAGCRCVVLEARNIGFGTTGGTTAHLNTLMDTPYATMIRNFGKEHAQQVALAARAALDLVKNNVERYAISCGFSEAPAFLFSQTEEQDKELQQIHDSSIDVGVDLEYVENIPVPFPFRRALRVERQAKFHPLRYVQGLAEAFRRAGGMICEQCRVLQSKEKEHDKETIVIETTSGNVEAGALVYATHIPTGANILHLRCSPYRSYAMAVKLNDDRYPEGLAYDLYEPYHYYRTQEIDGEKFLIAGGEDHRTGDGTNSSASLLKLESHIRAHFDVSEIRYQWSSQYYEPADGLPYIGHFPGHPENVFVATGYGGNGMTYSHVAAIILRELVMKRDHPWASVFLPGRIKPVAGFTEFVKHNAEVVKQFAGKLFEAEKIETLAELAPGEGKLVDYENEKLALYKDERGALHAVNPTCTHLKCSVRWNASEKSWDCPCHGARYSYEGEVLNGPADRALEKIEIQKEKDRLAEWDR